MIDEEAKELAERIIIFGEVSAACAIGQTFLLLLLFVLVALNGEKEKPQTSKEQEAPQKEDKDSWISWGSGDQAKQGYRQLEDGNKMPKGPKATETLKRDGYDWPWGLELPKRNDKEGQHDFFTTPQSPHLNIPSSFTCTCRACCK